MSGKEEVFSNSTCCGLKKWEFCYAGCEPHFQQAIIKDGICYCGNNESPKRLQAIDIYTGQLRHYLEIEQDCGREACACAPWISGAYIYFYAHGADRVYKLRLVDFVLEANWAAEGVSYVEAVAYDNTYFYLPEATKITKRKMDDGAIVATFSIAHTPKGILMIRDCLYFKTETKLYCLSKENMAEKWSLELDFSDTSYGIPIYDPDHNLLYMQIAKGSWDKGKYRKWGRGCIYAIEIDTHTIKWKKHYPHYATTQTLAYHNNRIFVPLFYYHGMEALEPLDGSVVWAKKYDNDYGWCSGSLDDRYIYRAGTREWGGDVQYSNYYFQIIRQTDGEIAHQESIKYSGVCAIATISDGMCILPTRGALIGFKIGSGSRTDYYPYHGNVYYTGYVAEAITSYDF